MILYELIVGEFSFYTRNQIVGNPLSGHNETFFCLLISINIFFFFGLLVDVTVDGVKIRSLKVPEAVRINHSIKLNCLYDLENEALYSIKWYRELEEFYRYVPKEEPPTRIFSIPDLNVDVSTKLFRGVKVYSSGMKIYTILFES